MHIINKQGITMGQILHGCASATAALRRTIQHSQESLKHLAERYHINAKTVAKWRKRTTVKDAPMGSRRPHSTVLTTEQEAAIVAFRRQTLLPLDDCLYALQATIPNLTRSALHRCLQRHGISRLPNIKGEKPIKKKFAQYPIGYFHIDIAEVCTEQGRFYLFVAIDRTSKFSYAELHFDKTGDRACQFLRQLIAIVPYHIHTILTDNGIQFTNRLKDKRAFKHMSDRICGQHKIEHRLTKVNHPWTNGQVERMNRTIKDATVKRFYYETHKQLKTHLQLFLTAYNFAKRLKTLKGLTAYEYISQCWQNQKERFKINPHHYTLGLNT
jgi:transposase InsO family protein